MATHVDRLTERPAQPETLFTVAQILQLDLLKDAEVLAGAEGLGRSVTRLNVMTTPDIMRWARSHEFMLSTEYPLPKTDAGMVQLVQSFASKNLAGLGIKFTAGSAGLPASLLARASELSLPVVRIPEDVGFDDILTTVLSEIINRQAARIARTSEMHQALLEIVLAGGRLRQIVERLAGLLGDAQVAVFDTDGRPLASSGRPGSDELVTYGLQSLPAWDSEGATATATSQPRVRGAEVIVSPIRTGGSFQAVLAARTDSWPAGIDPVMAVEQGALVVALDLVRESNVLAVQRKYESNVLHDLITGPTSELEDNLALGASFGWDLLRPVVVVVAQPAWSTAPGADASDRRMAEHRYATVWLNEIRKLDHCAAAAAFATNLVAVTAADRPFAEIGQALALSMRSATRREFSLGLSRVVSSPDRIARAYQEARAALAAGLRTRGMGTTTTFDELGLSRLLCLIEDESELRAFSADLLGPLFGLDAEERGDLLRTLSVLLEVHMNVAEAARVTHYHYNTMRYRISKLERLLGPFTTNGQLALMLAVALEIERLPST